MDEKPLIQRRLAAILAADIAGYSRSRTKTRPPTVQDLKVRQRAILPLIGRHGGRIIDTAGDGIMADPGGVLVSHTVYDQVRGKLPFTFEDVGERQAKNIEQPVRMYQLTPGAGSTQRRQPRLRSS